MKTSRKENFKKAVDGPWRGKIHKGAKLPIPTHSSRSSRTYCQSHQGMQIAMA